MSVRHPRRPALLFQDLPKRPAPVVRRAHVNRIADDVQPDLLEWTPPQTHLPGPEVDLQFFSPLNFRPSSGDAFLYHLTDTASATRYLSEGLPLQDDLALLDARVMVNALSENLPDRDLTVLRVRRRLVRRWLRKGTVEGHACYVLVQNASDGT